MVGQALWVWLQVHAFVLINRAPRLGAGRPQGFETPRGSIFSRGKLGQGLVLWPFFFELLTIYRDMSRDRDV